MATIEAPFRPATVRLLGISYDCDLTRQGGVVIPLGVLVDLSVVGMWYSLGLIARMALSTSEVEKIGALVRADFAAPFAYLHGVFNSVIRSEARSMSLRAWLAVIRTRLGSSRWKTSR